MGEDAPPPFLHARVLAHVRAEAKSPQREAWWARVPRWAWAGQALAVLLGVTLAGWGLWQGRMSRQPGESLVAVKAVPQVSHDVENGAPGEEQRRERAMPAAEAPGNEAPAVPPRVAPRRWPQGHQGPRTPPTAAIVAAAEPMAGGGAAERMGGVPAPASVAPVEADAERARGEGERAAKDERTLAATGFAPEPVAEVARQDRALPPRSHRPTARRSSGPPRRRSATSSASGLFWPASRPGSTLPAGSPSGSPTTSRRGRARRSCSTSRTTVPSPWPATRPGQGPSRRPRRPAARLAHAAWPLPPTTRADR